MKKKSILLLSLLLMLFSNCKKEPSVNIGPNGNVGGHPLDELGLPHATTEGLNTMGCLMNGEPWLALAENTSGDLEYRVPFSYSSDGEFQVNGRRIYDSFYDNMTPHVLPMAGEGTYNMTLGTGIYVNFQTCGAFERDTTYMNFVNITRVDLGEQIISGTFEMRVINSECDTLTITNGRFDLSS